METQMRRIAVDSNASTMDKVSRGGPSSSSVPSSYFPSSTSALQLQIAPDLLQRYEKFERLKELDGGLFEDDVVGRKTEILLPKLVILGDGLQWMQFSALESILGLKLLPEGGVRAAIEIVWRHAETEKLNVVATIEDVGVGKLTNVSTDLESLDEIPAIIHDLLKQDNVDMAGQDVGVKLIRIQVTGPIGLRLLTLDLSGLASGSEAITEGILKDPEAVFLVAVRAAGNIDNHDGLAIGRRYDPSGERILTLIIDLEDGGQDMLKNLADALQSFEFEDRTFIIGGDQAGMDQLRVKLQEYFDSLTRYKLDNIQGHIKRQLTNTEGILKKLGDTRLSLAEIRQFMADVSQRFRDISHAALKGDYGNSSLFDFFAQGDGTRLMKLVQDSNMQFEQTMREDGQVWKLSDTSVSDGFDPEAACAIEQVIVSKTEMMKLVKKEYYRSRGTELPGGSTTSLEAGLFRQQSARWPDLAKEHVLAVLKIVEIWMGLAVVNVTDEKKLQVDLGQILGNWLRTAKQSALEELNKLIGDEKRSPSTYNQDFTYSVEMVYLDGQRDVIQNAVGMVTHLDRSAISDGDYADEIASEIASEIESHVRIDLVDQVCHDAYVRFDKYYKVARNRFVDNIARQVIERHITSPIPEAFSPVSVSMMPDEELLRIGSSTPEQVAEHTRLLKRIKMLRQVLFEKQ